MRFGVVGSRGFTNYQMVKNVLEQFLVQFPNFILISGGAQGADSLGERFADEHGLEKIIHLPDWDKYGRSAGYIRNQKIVKDSDAVVAFWDGQSKGTEHTIDLCRSSGKGVFVFAIEKDRLLKKTPQFFNNPIHIKDNYNSGTPPGVEPLAQRSFQI